MANGPKTKGFGERVADSARDLAGGLMSGGVVLEREMGELSLRAGKAGSMGIPARGAQIPEIHDRRPGALRADSAVGARETMRSDVGRNELAHEFQEFEQSTEPDIMDTFDVEGFLYGRSRQVQDECTETSAHALPAELRSLALDRLRQIEGHISGSKASREAQRRTELENEWLLWWDESPTACFDDSREYFANDAQRSYAEAWESHLASPTLDYGPRPYIANAPDLAHGVLAPPHPLPLEQHTTSSKEKESSRCPNEKSHEDLTACGRSMPIAAQHRPCPHTGCGFCSQTSAGWFEHLRGCER